MSLYQMSLYQEACKYIPGGVNSPVRAFRSVGGEPIFFKKAAGAHTFAADGRQFIDYVGSWGPMILGHAHPQVIAAVQAVAADGLSFGAPTELETRLARRVVELMPAIELVRFVSSGTEATMSAIRLARGFTGRDTIVKFEGCYHGHSDSLLIKAGSGALTFGVPSSPGVPRALAAHTVTLDYNDSEQVREVFRRRGAEIACVIVEPVAGNMNCVLPAPGFLETLRRECDRAGALLIFDEVMTGFRVALGGAQALYGIRPDLTTLGKIIGGGMPVGAFGGRRDIMERLAPLGPIYQAGTLSGNPVAMAAGIATLELIAVPGFHERLSLTTDSLVQRLAGGGRGRRHRARHQPGVRHVRVLLHERAQRRQLRESDGLRRRALQTLLSPHARAGSVLRAVGVRSGVRLGGAFGRRHRCDRCRGGEDLRQPTLRLTGLHHLAGLRLVRRYAARRRPHRRGARLPRLRRGIPPWPVAVSSRGRAGGHADSRARARVAVQSSSHQDQTRFRLRPAVAQVLEGLAAVGRARRRHGGRGCRLSAGGASARPVGTTLRRIRSERAAPAADGPRIGDRRRSDRRDGVSRRHAHAQSNASPGR